MKTALLLFIGSLAGIATVSAEGKGAKPNFSGEYAVNARWKLTVGQTKTHLRITETSNGRAITKVLNLDGSETPCRSVLGGEGTCTARFDGNVLLLDEQTAEPDAAGRPPRAVHVRDRWVLSEDGNAIRVERFVSTKGTLGGADISILWRKVQSNGK